MKGAGTILIRFLSLTLMKPNRVNDHFMFTEVRKQCPTHSVSPRFCIKKSRPKWTRNSLYCASSVMCKAHFTDRPIFTVFTEIFL